MKDGIDVKTDNAVRVYSCSNWIAFLQEVRKSRVILRPDKSALFGQAPIFRGHAATDWALASTVERNLAEAPRPLHLRTLYDTEQYANDILTRFRLAARGLPGFDIDASDIDHWVLGRHHGLVSPYLDWTLSPFVAAFFAYADILSTYSGMRSYYPAITEGKVCIWGLRMWEQSSSAELEIVHGNTIHGSRARAQQSAFTRLKSASHFDLESYLSSIGQAHCLERYDIDLSDAQEALIDLGRMNISYLTLFPDMVGAALNANLNEHIVTWTHRMKNFNASQ